MIELYPGITLQKTVTVYLYYSRSYSPIKTRRHDMAPVPGMGVKKNFPFVPGMS